MGLTVPSSEEGGTGRGPGEGSPRRVLQERVLRNREEREPSLSRCSVQSPGWARGMRYVTRHTGRPYGGHWQDMKLRGRPRKSSGKSGSEPRPFPGAVLPDPPYILCGLSLSPETEPAAEV